MTVMPPKFVVLAILDGWGIALENPGNAIKRANTINMDKFWVSCPHAELEASGDAVGLPKGEDGNTETGHLNLGAGKIVYQDLQRINMAISDESFYKNSVLLDAVEHAKKNNSSLHLMGLVGAGGVHSNIEHLFALLHLAKRNNLQKVFVHVFTDGRDSPPNAAKTYLKRLEDEMQKEGIGKIASIMGRYYAMDRDQRWDRTAKAYELLTKGTGRKITVPEEAVDFSYSEGITDEFIEPSIVCDANGQPVSLISDNDAVIFFNFRIDRPRQLTKAFVFTDLKKGDLTYDFDTYIFKYEMKKIL
jgi:2,3-bisphosphoglycerate-independent phosphoglycerate mutase